jgi:hypothetical protein
MLVLLQRVRERWVEEWNEIFDIINRKQFKPVLHSLAQGMDVPSISQFENKA